jgi:hypothetical protein
MPRRHTGGVNVQLHSFLKLGTKSGMGGQSHAPAALPSGMNPYTHCTGDWVDIEISVEGCRKCCLHQDANRGTSNS